MVTMSLVDAVEAKYAMMSEINFPGIRVSGSPGKTGSGRLILPYVLVMDDCSIEEAGDEQRLQRQLKEVVDLDLGKNRLSSWPEVLKILRCVPLIESINLNLNPLGQNEQLPDIPPAMDGGLGGGGGLDSLRTLILNSTGVSWAQVFALLPGLPKLQELHLGMNNFDEVPTSDLSFPNIHSLYFNGNRLSCLAQVALLGRLFPELEQLLLIENCITAEADPEEPREVEEEEGQPVDYSALGCLFYLNLSKNAVAEWPCVDHLRQLPALTDLRIGGNPLFDDWSEKDCREHVIARLPSLVRLNGSAIDATEREDAERSFIRHFMDCEEKPERFCELEKCHGRLDPLANVNLAPRKVINFLIRFGEGSRMHNLNIDQTVGSAKRELGALYSLNPANFHLYYVDHEVMEVMGHEHLRYNGRALHSYRPQDGDELIIELKRSSKQL